MCDLTIGCCGGGDPSSPVTLTYGMDEPCWGSLSFAYRSWCKLRHSATGVKSKEIQWHTGSIWTAGSGKDTRVYKLCDDGYSYGGWYDYQKGRFKGGATNPFPGFLSDECKHILSTFEKMDEGLVGQEHFITFGERALSWIKRYDVRLGEDMVANLQIGEDMVANLQATSAVRKGFASAVVVDSCDAVKGACDRIGKGSNAIQNLTLMANALHEAGCELNAENDSERPPSKVSRTTKSIKVLAATMAIVECGLGIVDFIIALCSKCTPEVGKMTESGMRDLVLDECRRAMEHVQGKRDFAKMQAKVRSTMEAMQDAMCHRKDEPCTFQQQLDGVVSKSREVCADLVAIPVDGTVAYGCPPLYALVATVWLFALKILSMHSPGYQQQFLTTMKRASGGLDEAVIKAKAKLEEYLIDQVTRKTELFEERPDGKRLAETRIDIYEDKDKKNSLQGARKTEQEFIAKYGDSKEWEAAVTRNMETIAEQFKKFWSEDSKFLSDRVQS